MNSAVLVRALNGTLRWAPLLFLAALCLIFGSLAPRFLTGDNLMAILTQSSWLIVVALGMNFVLLTAGVDLSVGVSMYLAAITVGLGFAGAPFWIAAPAAILVGGAFGVANGFLVIRLGMPPFIVTLAMTFIGRGLGLFLTSTKEVGAGPKIAALSRSAIWGLPVTLWIAIAAGVTTWLVMRATEFGVYVRAIGADREAARRAGVPVQQVTWGVYALCGAFAGLGGIVSLAQTASASAAFGLNAEFLAIAAAVLGGTSLFGGRGGLWAPIIGAILIMTVQNGMGLINANPYAYPVTTGAVIFCAAALDTLRFQLVTRIERRPIRVSC